MIQYELLYANPIPGYPDYLVTEDGEVWSAKYGNLRIRKVQKSKIGYDTINLKQNGVSKTFSVHRLVAMAWFENKDNLPVVNHKNGEKTDNKVVNLEYVTHRDNAIHSLEVLGNKTILSRSHEKIKRPVVQATLDGTFIARFASMTAASEATGVDDGSMSLVCQNKRISSGGYLWAYEDQFEPGKPIRKRQLKNRIDQYTLDGEYIQSFDMIKDACEYLGKPLAASGISKVCRGLNETCHGYIWKYADKIFEKDETENRKICPRYPKYKVSSDGLVFSMIRKRLIKQFDHHGYKRVSLVNIDGKQKSVSINRLVAEIYLSNDATRNIVNHKDGKKDNNIVENLEWCTYSENAQHAHDTGLIKSKKAVNQMDDDGNTIAIFDSMITASKTTGIKPSCISHVCCGRTQTAGGYKWKYA